MWWFYLFGILMTSVVLNCSSVVVVDNRDADLVSIFPVDGTGGFKTAFSKINKISLKIKRPFSGFNKILESVRS